MIKGGISLLPKGPHDCRAGEATHCSSAVDPLAEQQGESSCCEQHVDERMMEPSRGPYRTGLRLHESVSGGGTESYDLDGLFIAGSISRRRSGTPAFEKRTQPKEGWLIGKGQERILWLEHRAAVGNKTVPISSHQNDECPLGKAEIEQAAADHRGMVRYADFE